MYFYLSGIMNAGLFLVAEYFLLCCILTFTLVKDTSSTVGNTSLRILITLSSCASIQYIYNKRESAPLSPYV